MQVKGKIFPYPVLNSNQAFSNYNGKSFQIVYEPSENSSAFILRNCKFETDSELIKNLYLDGKIGIVLIVECSDTVYRKAFEVTPEEKDIKLLKTDFSEKVDISMMAYAKDNFKMDSDEFDEDYSGISFEIEKYDIVGANDGFNVRFTHDETQDNLVKSIFSIIPSDSLQPGAYQVECDIGKKIVISLSKQDHSNYYVIYTVPTYKEVFFNMILVPALVEAISLCKSVLEDESKDMDDVGNQYLWFRSVMMAYKKLKGNDLTIHDFKSTSSVTFAQELLGNPLGQALQNLVSEINRPMSGDENNG